MERRARRGDHGDARALAESGDAALISRVRAGDVPAYGILYERHEAAARGLARHLAGRDAADDAVQDAFAKVLDVLKRGGGPDAGFRPYLLTVVRRTVYDRQRADRRVHRTDAIETFDPGEPFEDPALVELERSMVTRAFRSLPGRWQTVLWHTEVEGAKPAEVAPLLGLTANGAAALAYRAREGLRQAYLQMHLDGLAADDGCRPALDKLGSYVRGALAKRDSRNVKRHLDGCARCKGIHAELADVNTALRDVLGPLVVGSATAGYLASKGGGAFLWFRHLPKRQQQVLGGGVVAVAGALAVGLMLVSGDEPFRPARTPPVAAKPAEPAVPPAAKPPAQPRPPVAKPAPLPSEPAPRPKDEPRRTIPDGTPPPKRPGEPAPPGPSTERPGGIHVHIHLRTKRHRVKIHVHVRAGRPHGVPRHRPRGAPRRGPRGVPRHKPRVSKHVPHHVTDHAGRHGRLKPGSRGHRD